MIDNDPCRSAYSVRYIAPHFILHSWPGFQSRSCLRYRAFLGHPRPPLGLGLGERSQGLAIRRTRSLVEFLRLDYCMLQSGLGTLLERE